MTAPFQLLEYALDYAHRGWHVFPCWQGDKSPCVGAQRDSAGNKIPKTGGLYKATTDAAMISTWWTRWPSAMIGVRMGASSGVWAIDPDAPKQAAIQTVGPSGPALLQIMVRSTRTHI